ncbi:S8 family peptidase [Natronomonas sp. EA1]|uniref:S8 family peptidase n=1 Tax=Natronomonas sp. EA1 TaxID=3421655 RepID=UPI003EBC5BD9
MVTFLTRRAALRAVGGATALLVAGLPARATAVEDRFIVDTCSCSSEELAGLRVVHDLPAIGLQVVRGPRPDVRCSRDVAFGIDLPLRSHEATHVEAPLLDFQWDRQYIPVAEAHAITDGSGARVAVIDTGIDGTHPALTHAVNTELSKNFTEDGGDYTDIGFHGTHVSGIIAAAPGDAGLVGMAPGVDLVACRVFSAASALFGDVIAAMVYAAEIDADAANLSLGAYPLPLDDPEVQLLREAVDRAVAFGEEQGTVYVAAAGNDGANLDADGEVISLPNEAENVLSVSATGPIGYRWDDEPDEDDPLNRLEQEPSEIAFYSNFGEDAIDVSAPGGNADRSAIGTDAAWYLDLVLSTVPGGYGWAAGTSMAAPQVAGTVALVRSLAPTASARAVREHLRETARGMGQAEFHGAGHLDPVRAVEDAADI